MTFFCLTDWEYVHTMCEASGMYFVCFTEKLVSQQYAVCEKYVYGSTADFMDVLYAEHDWLSSFASRL